MKTQQTRIVTAPYSFASRVRALQVALKEMVKVLRELRAVAKELVLTVVLVMTLASQLMAEAHLPMAEGKATAAYSTAETDRTADFLLATE